MLSHEKMRAAILNGGVVQMPSGVTIHRVEDLPTPADLAIASASAGQRAATKADLKAKQDELAEQIKRLELADNAALAEQAARQKAEADAAARKKAEEDAAKNKGK